VKQSDRVFANPPDVAFLMGIDINFQKFCYNPKVYLGASIAPKEANQQIS
jgi:hypothetical protein